jgi:4'-phosphopantetheinyl transferase EntD
MEAEVLTSVLAGVLAPDIVALGAPAALATAQLFADEREHIARAIEKRQAEFGTARVLARRALASLGVASQSLLPQTDRSPRWPPGIVGSISHAGGCCVVAVASTSSYMGIGIDLEAPRAMKPNMQASICTTRELAWLQSHASPDSPWLEVLTFSAKESFYKCQYPLTRTALGFQDVDLEIDLGIDLQSGSFLIGELSSAVPDQAILRRIQGRWHWSSGLLITTALLKAAP